MLTLIVNVYVFNYFRKSINGLAHHAINMSV